MVLLPLDLLSFLSLPQPQRKPYFLSLPVTPLPSHDRLTCPSTPLTPGTVTREGPFV